MRQDIPIHSIKLDQPLAYQLLWHFSQISAKAVHIHGIQYNGVSHSLTAVMTACTVLAVCLYHII